MAALKLRVTPRVINGRMVCAGDCPMFSRTGKPMVGYCLESARACLVGQLCYQPVGRGGNRYPRARFLPKPTITARKVRL